MPLRACIRVETQNMMVLTRQNWSDITVSKNAIMTLREKVDERKTAVSKIASKSEISVLSKVSKVLTNTAIYKNATVKGD